MKKKLAVILVVLYVIMPLDLLPEWILGPLGFLDDLGLVAWAFWYLRRPKEREQKQEQKQEPRKQ
jgi:uncharacterized membrane protein YkvA (DUF1232 family)